MLMAEYSKTFCPYPWIHVMTQPGSTVNLCCVATGQIKNDDGSVVLLSGGDEISSVWNNKHYKEIRRQMIEGERLEA